jgi:hypothetical protein
MANKCKVDAAGPLRPPPIGDRWLRFAERIAVDLVVLVLLVRTLASSFADGPGVEQALAAGVLAALVLVQSERR